MAGTSDDMTCTDDLREKIRCLEAILALEPDLEWAQAALEGMQYRLVREN